MAVETPPCGPVAQLVEHGTFNLVVVGSSPTGPTTFFNRLADFQIEIDLVHLRRGLFADSRR